MEVETIYKMIASAVAIVGVARVVLEVSFKSKEKLRQEYRFAKEFLNDLSKTPSLHPFAVERGYFALAGTAVVSFREIEYILSLENSGRCLKDYVLSRRYLLHINPNAGEKIDFASKYKSNWSRLWRKAWFLTGYALAGFAAIVPLLLFQQFDTPIKEALIVSIFTLPVFGLVAFERLWSYIRIARAEILVRSQSKHYKTIFVQ